MVLTVDRLVFTPCRPRNESLPLTLILSPKGEGSWGNGLIFGMLGIKRRLSPVDAKERRSPTPQNTALFLGLRLGTLHALSRE